MSLSLILLLILLLAFGIYSFSFLALNKKLISVDLLFLDLNIEIGQIILISILTGILFAIILEILFFSSKRRKKDE